MEYIESFNNSKIKFINSLKLKKQRKKERKFIAEGERLVFDSIKKEKPLYIVIAESFKKDVPSDILCYKVKDEIYNKITDTVNPQGIMAVYEIKEKRIEDIDNNNILILNNVTDPGNMGTLLRTALAFNFKNILIDSISCDLYNPKTIRSTMSAIFDLNIFMSSDLKKDILFLNNKGFFIYPATLNKDSLSIYDLPYKKPFGIIIGNEARGVDRDIISVCKNSVIIPMEDEIESLNASVAGAIIMSEISRREKHE